MLAVVLEWFSALGYQHRYGRVCPVAGAPDPSGLPIHHRL